MRFDYSKVIFENSRDAILVHSPDTTILDANHAACDLLGYAKEELVGKRIADFAEMHSPLKEAEIQALRATGYIVFEREIVRKDGSTIPVEVSNSLMVDEGEEIIIAILRDLRDWYQAKKDLIDSEERFRTFVEQSMDAILLVDNRGLIREWNRSMEKISGLKKESVIDTPIWVVMDRLGIAQGPVQGSQAQPNQERVEQALRTGESVFFNRVQEYEFTSQNGEKRSVSQIIFPIKRMNELWVGCIIQDNNDLKKKQREVVNSEARLRAILDNIQTGILIVDPSNHSIVDANPAAVKMFGAPRELIIGSICHNFICPADVGKCPVIDLNQNVECSERTLIRIDRTRSPIIKTVTSFLLEGRSLLLESFIDITERKQMEEKLRQSEEQLRLLTSNLKDAIYLIDVVPKVRFRYISAAVATLLGYSAREIETMENPMALMHPDDLIVFHDLIFGSSRKWSTHSSLRMRMRRKDGEYVWIDTRNTCVAGEDGKLSYIEGSARDISAEMKVMADLERTARTDKMISSLSTRIAGLKTSEIDDGVTRALASIGEFVKADWCFIYSSANGNGPIEMTHSWASPGTSGPGRFPINLEPSDFPLVESLLQGGDVLVIPDIRTQESLNPKSYEFLNARGIRSLVIIPSIMDGELRGYLGFGTVDRLTQWHPDEIRMLNITGDMLSSVLNRQRAEDRLDEERERLAVTLRSIGDGVITVDKTGHIILANTAAEEMTGLNRYSMVGLDIRDVVDLPFTEWNKINSEDSGGPFRNDIKDLNGTARLMEYGFTTLLGSRDEDIGKVFVFRDITQRSRAETAEANAERLESIGTLAGGIAHDFNNVITSVTGELFLLSSEISRCGSPMKRSMERLEEIGAAMDRAKFVAQGLLSLSKGGAPIRRRMMLKGLLEDTVRLALTGSRTGWTLECPDGLWPVNVDSGQISKAFLNVLINAEEACTSASTIGIVARNYEGAPASLPHGRYLMIEFSDHGAGIPPEVLPRIFDPYFTTKANGTGLGMTVTYSTIRRHGGDIEISSEVSKGTTVTMYIPAFESPIESYPAQQTITTGAGLILVMDDEESILEVTGEVLQALGYQADSARNGQEALEKYKGAMLAGRKFDAVIMDLTIPGGMGGKEAVTHLLEMDPDAKAIVSSGYSSDPVMANFLDYGFVGVVPKPYQISELSDILKKALGSNV